MLYGNYVKKLDCAKRALLSLWKLRYVLLALIALLVTGASLLGVTGKVYGEALPASFAYGEEVTFRAKSVFKEVVYEYRDVSGEWTEEVPTRAGDYFARARSESVAGVPRYGKELPFSILPLEREIRIEEEELLYGREPTLTYALKEGDRFESAGTLSEWIDDYSFRVRANLNGARVLNAEGEDVSDCYTLSAPWKTFTPLARPLTIETASGAWIYDGERHAAEQFTLTEGAGLLPGDRLNAFFTGAREAGEWENAARFTVTDEEGADVTRFYRMTLLFGALTIEKRPLSLSTESETWVYDAAEHSHPHFRADGLVEGHSLSLPQDAWHSILNAGSIPNALPDAISILDEQGEEVGKNYEITRQIGILTVTKRALSLKTEDGSFTYDGAPHSAKTFTAEGLLPAHTLTLPANAWRSVTEAGSVENTLPDELSILDIQGTNVVENYEITRLYGMLTMAKRPITLETYGQSFLYDGTPHARKEYNETVLKEGVLPAHTATVTMNASYVNAGSYDNTASVRITENGTGREVGSNYQVTYRLGKITVTKRKVKVSTGSGVFVYDGTPKWVLNYEVLEGEDGYLAGHAVKEVSSAGQTAVTDSATKAGTVPNRLNFTVRDQNGADVSGNYEFVGDWGTIRVKTPVIVTLYSLSKQYDGTPLSYRETDYAVTALPPDLDEAELKKGLVVHLEGSLTDVGALTLDELKKKCTAELSAELTEQPNRVEIRGAAEPLRILPRRIEISSASLTALPSSTPLTASECWISFGSLVAGHSWSCSVTGSLAPGEEEASNTIENVIVRDAAGQDVTKNYEIILRPGTLRFQSGSQ